MVVTFFNLIAETGMVHARTAAPSRCTVHAPHWAMPHPYFVPTRPSASRNTHSSGVSASTSVSTTLPLTFILYAGIIQGGYYKTNVKKNAIVTKYEFGWRSE